MFIQNNKFLNKINRFINKNFVLYFLLIFNVLFCFVNLYKQIFVIDILFFLINFVFVIFATKKNLFYLLFFLYPLARVLKFPNFGTSILTILLGISYIILISKFLLNKKKLTKPMIATSLLFVAYVLFTFLVSLINKGFAINALLSYYLYLAFPFVAFVCVLDKNEINGTNNLILCMASYLIGLLITLLFYKLIPNGTSMLKNLGINVFEMGTAGIRFSPLTDDPNYGTALILLIACIFIITEKTKKQKIYGYPILILSLGLSCLSLSKMLILCVFVLIFCFLIFLMKKTKNLIINSTILLFMILGIIIFLSSSFGTSLIVRTIGTRDGLSLNRITSGRTELFEAYSSYILSNPLVVLFGKGPLYIDKSTFALGEHNTFTKNIFGNGIVGVTIMLVAFYIMMKNRFDKIKSFPRNDFFIGLTICLFICCMSLGLAPSTVFPIFVVAFQFAEIKNTKYCSTFKEEITI